MERALQQRPGARQPAQARPVREAAAAGDSRTAAQLRLAEEINGGPSVARLMALGRVLNGAPAAAQEIRGRPPIPASPVVQRADAAREDPDFDPEIYDDLIRETFVEEEEEEEDAPQGGPEGRKRKGMEEPDEDDDEGNDDEPRIKMQKLPDDDDGHD